MKNEKRYSLYIGVTLIVFEMFIWALHYLNEFLSSDEFIPIFFFVISVINLGISLSSLSIVKADEKKFNHEKWRIIIPLILSIFLVIIFILKIFYFQVNILKISINIVVILLGISFNFLALIRKKA